MMHSCVDMHIHMATAHYDYIHTIYVRHSRSMFDQMMCRIFDIVIDTLICDIIEIIALLIIPTMNTNNAYVYIYIYIQSASISIIIAPLGGAARILRRGLRPAPIPLGRGPRLACTVQRCTKASSCSAEAAVGSANRSWTSCCRAAPETSPAPHKATVAPSR